MRSYLFAFLFLIGVSYGNAAKAGYDLIVSDITSSPPYVNFTIKNLGSTHFYGYQTLRVYSASTGAYRYFNYYLSVAPYGGTRGASWTLAELGAASAASQPTQSFTAYADYDRQVYETNESNNSLTKSVFVGTPRPDMIVEDIYVESGWLKVKVKNAGTLVTAGYPQVQVTANGITREQQIYTQIPAGGNNVYAFYLTDFNLSAGQSYSITAVADSYNQMYESNESNNGLTKNISLVGNLPDLVVTDIVEEVDRIKWTVKNIGTADVSRAFYLRYSYPSTSTAQLIWSLPPGQETYIYAMKSSMSYIDGNTYEFYGMVDEDFWITESNEANNTLTKNIRIGAANLPDLIMKPTVIDGSDIVFSFEVIANPAGDPVIPYYNYPLRLSMNVGTQSMSKDYPSLVAGVYTERYPLSWFYLTANATFNARGEIDSAKWVAEKEEGNNINSVSLCNGTCVAAGVDLQITSVSRYLNGSYVYALVNYKNAGTSTSASKFRIKVELNGQVVTSFSDLSVPAAGASSSNYIYLGTNISTGTLKATIDHANTVVETNETNNVLDKPWF